MKSSQKIAIFIAVLAAIWIVSGLLLSGGDKLQEPQEVQKEQKFPEVRVRLIRAESYTDDLVVTGRSQASKSVRMRAETEGLVENLLKEEGEKAAKGDVLAKIEIRDRGSKLREAKERLNQRQIEYNAARRLAGEGFNSKVRLAQSLADLESAKATLKDAQFQLDKTSITAPFESIIAVQEIEVGNYLSVGDPIFTLVDLDPIEFTGFISEKRIRDIELGRTSMAEILGGKTLEGKVSYIAPAADPQTRTFRVIMSAPNPDLKIREGLTAKIHIPVSQKTAYKISPSILSLNDIGKIGVKIVDEKDIVQFVPVKILADKPEAMWIESVGKTLPAEARFITVGQEFVGAGEKVKPVKSKGDGLL